MTRRQSPVPVESTEVATLSKVVEELSRQIRQLALIMDEVREELLGAVRNSHLDPCVTRRIVDSYLGDDDEEFDDYDDHTEDDSPVQPPPVRATSTDSPNAQRSLFS